MKVKIAYTIDTEDVPREAQRLTEIIKEQLSMCCRKISFRPDNVQKMAQEFQEVTTGLSLVGNQLQDLLNITAGWVDAINGQEDQNTDDPTPEAEVITDE